MSRGASGRVGIWLNGAFCGAYQGPMADRDDGARRKGAPFITHSRTMAVRDPSGGSPLESSSPGWLVKCRFTRRKSCHRQCGAKP